MELTNPRIFERRDLCVGCGLDLNDYHENTPERINPATGDPCQHPDFKPEHVRSFVPGAATVPDVHLARTPVGGMRHADGGHLGDPLVDIERPFVYHSPDGYEWGCGGSGPSDLALNILALFVPPPEAWRLHHRYKDAVVARIPREGGTITAESVRDWIRAEWAARPEE